METRSAIQRKSAASLNVNEDRLLQVVQLSDYDGSPAIKLWILLNRQPGVSSVQIDELIEKGVLNIELALKDHHLLLPESIPIKVVKADLQLYNGKKDKVIDSRNSFGTDAVFNFQSALNAEECVECEKAFTDEPSSIHLKGSILFQNERKEIEVRFLLPLRKLINEKFDHLAKNEKQKHISIRYFDFLTVSYKEAPVFITNRAIRFRDFAMASAKLIKVNNDFVNPAIVVAPGPLKLTGTNNPGASLNPKNKLWYFDDIRIKIAVQPEKPSLPVVKDDQEAVWMDSVDAKKIWYMPEYKIEVPSQTDTAANSPFVLSFEKIGTDLNGKPVLKGEVKISLSAVVPAEAAAKALSIAGSRLSPVNIQSQQFILRLPFMESNGAQKTSDISPSEIVSANNRIQLTFLLTNDWIRNCYGVLSIEGFQQSKATISIYTCFTGLGTVQKTNVLLLPAAGFLMLDVVKTDTAIKAAAFNIASRTLVIDDTRVRFADANKTRAAGKKTGYAGKVAMLNAASIANTIVMKPGNELPAKVEQGDELVQRSFGKMQTAEVFFPCKDFGQFYLEEIADGLPHAIGCYEPYRMGEIKFRLYEEITTLATSYYKVHRSLQSPDHFLIQPARYRVTRFDAMHPEMAFKACVHMYGAIDEQNNFQNSVCVLDLSLDPDIPMYAFHLLKQELKKQCNKKPVIEFPGEVMEDAVFTLSLPEGTKVNTLNLGRTVQLTVSIDIMEVLTLQAMLKNGVINGKASYTMADKTVYDVNLSPDTANITGPWENGPLEIVKSSGAIKFNNKTEKTVQLEKVVRTDGDANDLETFTINRTLLPGESVSIDTPNTMSVFMPDCIVQAKASDLDESWVFMNDMTCQVIISTPIDLAAQNITSIDVEASVVDGPVKIYTGSLTAADPAFEFETYISLTKVAGPRMVSYRTRINTASAAAGFSEWKQWPVKEQGNIINLTSDLLSHN
jgi:hypothetical protein